MNEDAAILILNNSKMAIPIHTDALHVADGPKRKIEKKYVNSLLVFANGNTFIVKDIVVTGLYGESLVAKFISLLNSNWKITVNLVKQNVSIEEIKLRISSCLNEESGLFFNLNVSPEKVPKLLSDAKSFADIFYILNVNDDDLLDVL
jgi:hypothetical protein